MKKIITLLSVIALICSCFAFSVSAASSATIALSSKNPKVNDTVTVTVTVKAGAPMYGTEFNVNYSQNVLKFESGDSAAGGAGVVKVAGLPAGAASQSYTLKFTAISAGSSLISVSGGAFLENTDESIAASTTISVTDASKSTNANLASLRVGAGTLSPKFSPNVTEYTVNTKSTDTKCLIYATVADPNASFIVNGSADLKVGTNTRVIVVTAPSGAQKSYTLTIIRPETDENTSSTTDEPTPLDVVIDGNSYVVLKDISAVELPVGFNVTKRLYNNEEISVAIDAKQNFELFYLKAAGSEEIAPYTYDTEKNLFTRVQIITQGSNSYIVAQIPDDMTLPKNYFLQNVKIQDMSVNAYLLNETKLKDMYYIYCYFGGEYSMYRYDSKENVLQRYPELVPFSKDSEPADTDSNAILSRFTALSTTAKTIVVCLLIAAIGVVVLTVLLIIKFATREKAEDYDLLDNFEDSFVDISVENYNEDKSETQDEAPEDIDE